MNIIIQIEYIIYLIFANHFCRFKRNLSPSPDLMWNITAYSGCSGICVSLQFVVNAAFPSLDTVRRI